eukprot:1209062-Amphidinium_carterae.1
MVLPRFHKPNEIKLDNSVNSRYNPSKPTTFDRGRSRGDQSTLTQQANIPKQRRQPPQPTKREQEQNRITHMPYTGIQIMVPNLCLSQRTFCHIQFTIDAEV